MLAGVDGCPGGWAAAVANSLPGPIEIRVESRIGNLLSSLEPLDAVAIDMPIGLSPDGRRRCDIEARRLLGDRRSTLFFAPPSCVLDASSHAEACELAYANTGKKISIQAWNLVPKIKELARTLDERPGLRAKVFETHPELCFAAIAGGNPLAASKKSEAGQKERLRVLRRAFTARHVDACLAEARGLPKQPPIVDQLDALACLSTAWRKHRSLATVLPVDAAAKEPRIAF